VLETDTVRVVRKWAGRISNWAAGRNMLAVVKRGLDEWSIGMPKWTMCNKWPTRLARPLLQWVARSVSCVFF
jgi:hypothetical protein